MEQSKVIGDSVNRIEGRLKVTGAANYAVEYPLDNLCYGVLVTSTIAKGSISKIDTMKAKNAGGVIAILSHLNRPDVPGYQTPIDPSKARYYGWEYRLFADASVRHYNQPVAMVVAETLEQAIHAARLVRIQYHQENHSSSLLENLEKAATPHQSTDSVRGNADAWDLAEVKLAEEYHTPIQVHNPMEPHAASAWWPAQDKVVIYNKTQFVQSTKNAFMKFFNLKSENVEVIAPFVGGAFGSASRVWPHEMAAVLASKFVGRPVRVALKREQVFNMVGYRPQAKQQFKIGADKDGTFKAIQHIAWGMTSSYEEFVERITDPTKTMYACPNLLASYKLVPLDVSTPTHARGPGETTGSFALESAVDELAYKLGMDPIALRVKNFAAEDPEKRIPWTSNELRACFTEGAKLFGWDKRKPDPGTQREGNYLIGSGMSAGIYKSTREPASVSAAVNADGIYTIKSSVTDNGQGSSTIFSQIAADTLNTAFTNIRFLWGISSLPPAPGQFGSHTTTTVGSAVRDACLALKQKIKSEGKGKTLTVTIESKAGTEEKTHSGKSFCANFVEVAVHQLTGEVRVQRVVSAVDCGRIINHKTAESQVLGSITWGIGVALMEDGIIDHRTGSYVNDNLADYHLPVHADMPDITVKFIDREDKILDPIGAKGLGEIGMIGFSAAVANAVFHATGKRIRSLPITPDKIITYA